MVVKFLVKEKEINVDLNQNFKSLKNIIINIFNLKCKNIDLFLNTDKPLRGIGKYTLEKGIIHRSMDNYTMDYFNIDGKTLHLYFLELKGDYNTTPKKKIKIKKSFIKKENNINYDDLDEFPKLC